MTGQVIGNYRVIDRLGGGGMGKVYRAVDLMVEREVAMKALHPEIARQPETLERFRTEAVTLARLNHPSIAQLYTFFREGNDFYMVMEYVPGETLEARIQRGPIPWREAFEIAAAVLDAIHFAHSQGILHRDLKPANIMITPQGQVKVMDFGIAQALGRAKLTREGRVVGTVEYLAPERIRGGAPDARADLYSVGIVLYEMITGRLPFRGDTEYEIMMAQLNAAPDRPATWATDLPAEAEAAVLKALEKEPEQRYPDAQTFAAAVRNAAARAPSAAPVRVSRPWPRWWIGAGAGLAATLLLAAVLVVRSREADDPWKQARMAAPAVPDTPAETPAPPPPILVDPTPIPVRVPVAEPVPPSPAPVRIARPAAPAERAQPAETREPEPEPPKAAAPAAPEPVPAPAPPPVAAARRSVSSLADVREIYLEPMPGQLDDHLRAEIGERLGARMKVASSAAKADAVLKVSIEEMKGGSLSRAGRVFGLSDKTRVHASVVESQKGRVLWEERAGDRQVVTGLFKGDGMKRLAKRIVRSLEEDLR